MPKKSSLKIDNEASAKIINEARKKDEFQVKNLEVD